MKEYKENTANKLKRDFNSVLEGNMALFIVNAESEIREKVENEIAFTQ